MGTDVDLSASPAEFAAFLKKDNAFRAKLSRESGARIE